MKTPDKILCTNARWRKSHLSWFSSYMRAYRAKRKAAGLCIQCGIPRSEWEQVNSKTLCATCQFKAVVTQQDRRHAKLAHLPQSGLCHRSKAKDGQD